MGRAMIKEKQKKEAVLSDILCQTLLGGEDRNKVHRGYGSGGTDGRPLT